MLKLLKSINNCYFSNNINIEYILKEITMLKKSLITILFLLFILNTVNPAYASVKASGSYALAKNDSLVMEKFIQLRISIEEFLKEHLGFTEEDIQKSKDEGKNAFDLAKRSGITEKQLKDSIIEVKCKKIDEVLKKGVITEKMADVMKNIIKSRTEKWNGSFNTISF